MKNAFIIAIILFCTTFIYGQNDAQLNLRQSFFEPQEIIKVKEGHYFIDFGRAYFGTVQITSEAPQKDSIILHLGEKLESAHKVDRNPGATIRYRQSAINQLEVNKPVSVHIKPYKRNTSGAAIKLPDSVGAIIPFRYCEIENLKVPIESVTIQQKALHYKFNDDASYFSSSDKILDSIWNMCKHTIKATTFTGYYVDGDRERIPYEADAYINQLSHYSVDSVYTVARRTNEYFIDNPTWPTEWLLHTVLMFYTDYMYTGDLEPLKKHYDNLKLKTLMDLEREDGLISSQSSKLNQDLILKLGFKKPNTKIKDIIDWPPAQKDTGWKLATAEGERDGYEIVPVNTVVNAFYYYNLVLMEKIAKALNNTEDVLFYNGKANQVKQTINTKLFDSERGIYIDGEGSNHASLHGNMLALAFDLVPHENVKSVTNFIKTRGMACSVYGTQYLLEGLYKYNEPEYAFKLITDTTGDRNWWNMIKVGSTMAMEAWDVKYKPNLDWNHAWGTAPLNIVTRYMWGIRPKTPGFKTAVIEPKITNLKHSKINVPTQHGIIYGHFELTTPNEKMYSVEIPQGMTAEFIIADNAYKKVYLNGKKIKNRTTLLILKKGLNTIKIVK